MYTVICGGLSPQSAHNIYSPHMIAPEYTRAHKKPSALDPPRALPSYVLSKPCSNISMYKQIHTNKKKQLYI